MQNRRIQLQTGRIQLQKRRTQLQTGRIQLQKRRTQLQTGRIRRIQLQKPVSCIAITEKTFVCNIASVSPSSSLVAICLVLIKCET